MKKFLCLTLALVMLFSMLAMTACGEKDKGDDKQAGESTAFDYAGLDTDKYITLNASDYKGVTVEIDVDPEIDDEDVEAFLEYLCRASATSTKLTDVAVQEGDTANIYYRGTIDGVDFENSSNMTASSPDPLVIGSGNFIPGFEDNLIGVVPNTTSFTRITSGAVKEDYVVYVTYTYKYTAADGAEKTGSVTTAERIDLASPVGYDEAFIANIVGKTVGTAFTFTADVDFDEDGTKESVTYDMKVSFASIEEAVAVEATFPDPYKNNEELSGVTAVFYVVVQSLDRPVIPELTEELVKKQMGFESATGATGDAYLAEFREYVRKSLTEARASTNKNNALNKHIDNLMKAAVVKEYPAKAIEEVTTYYKEQLKYYFEGYSSQYSDFPYETEEEFAPDFFGIEEGTTYEDWLKKSAEEEVRYNMIINHIMDKEKISLSKKDKEEQVKALAEYYAASYSQQYGQNITADQIIEQFGEDALAEEALYNKVFEFLADNITIVENIVEPEETEAE